MNEEKEGTLMNEPLGRAEAGESVVAGISRDIVGVHAQHYGRGPTKAKTIWRDEVVVCILEEIFTKSEESLTAAGRFDQVRTNRQAFQDMVEPLFVQIVENATGRAVRAFFSQVDAGGLAAEIFVLEPQ